MRRFQSIADALRALPAKDLILEGEAVVARGIRDFELLHADLVAAGKDRLLYAGKVRGGFTEADARDLRERLDSFTQGLAAGRAGQQAESYMRGAGARGRSRLQHADGKQPAALGRVGLGEDRTLPAAQARGQTITGRTPSQNPLAASRRRKSSPSDCP
jgi:hypothetical protein